MPTANKLWPLLCGYMTLDAGVMHFGDASGPIRFPLPAFAIEHDRGLVLIDAGMRPDAHERPAAEVYGEALAAGFPTELAPEHRLDRQLERAGFSVQDVTHVIVSHTHADHVGGLYLFPQAEFFIQAVEARYVRWPMPFWAMGFGGDDLDRVRSSVWHELNGDLDLFGDGSIQLLSTPGHTPGHMSVLVKLPSRTFLLAIDAGHTMKNFEGIPCPADLNSIEAHESVERVKVVAAAHEADIWVDHDSGQWEAFAQVSGGLS